MGADPVTDAERAEAVMELQAIAKACDRVWMDIASDPAHVKATIDAMEREWDEE